MLCIDCQREAEKDGFTGNDIANWDRLIDADVADNDVVISDIELDVS